MSELRMRFPLSVNDLVSLATRFALDHRVPPDQVRLRTEGDEAVFSVDAPAAAMTFHCPGCDVLWRSESSSCWSCGSPGRARGL